MPPGTALVEGVCWRYDAMFASHPMAIGSDLDQIGAAADGFLGGRHARGMSGTATGSATRPDRRG